MHHSPFSGFSLGVPPILSYVLPYRPVRLGSSIHAVSSRLLMLVGPSLFVLFPQSHHGLYLSSLPPRRFPAVRYSLVGGKAPHGFVLATLPHVAGASYVHVPEWPLFFFRRAQADNFCLHLGDGRDQDGRPVERSSAPAGRDGRGGAYRRRVQVRN